ncbi:MAG: RNA polymerase sigma factor [Pirellulales bacterium]
MLVAIEELPVLMRDVVWLRNWQQLSFDEIGQRIGKTGEAARKLFSRAVQQLGHKLPADRQLNGSFASYRGR